MWSSMFDFSVNSLFLFKPQCNKRLTASLMIVCGIHVSLSLFILWFFWWFFFFFTRKFVNFGWVEAKDQPGLYLFACLFLCAPTFALFFHGQQNACSLTFPVLVWGPFLVEPTCCWLVLFNNYDYYVYLLWGQLPRLDPWLLFSPPLQVVGFVNKLFISYINGFCVCVRVWLLTFQTIPKLQR
jgi:hypothetical protein